MGMGEWGMGSTHSLVRFGFSMRKWSALTALDLVYYHVPMASAIGWYESAPLALLGKCSDSPHFDDHFLVARFIPFQTPVCNWILRVMAAQLIHANIATIMNLKCSKCGSEKIIPSAPLLDTGQNASGQLQALVGFNKPQAWIMKGPIVATMKANICGECGFMEFYANDPAALYKAYVQAVAKLSGQSVG